MPCSNRHSLLKFLFSFAIVVSCFTFRASLVAAIYMDSSNFKLDSAVNSGGGDSSSSNYDASTSIGEFVPGEFQSQGYIVKSGFQYLISKIPFGFTVSNTNINFGEIKKQFPVTANTELTISFGSGKYQVSAAEEYPLAPAVSARGCSAIYGTGRLRGHPFRRV